ncbi:MAG: DUF3168 domain-containing protein [Sphingomonadales bacterium]|nr:DUF3168 domain-containing protein [Sphingomonadales bacterium]MDE2169019.1 DUF3168 domain-containing protein [Sphingomonadales bacterium]
MEMPLRAALIGWLAGDPQLVSQLNSINEEAPSRTSLPWLAISASASTDWSTKTETGYEIRIALELHCRGDTPGSAGDLVAAIQARICSLPGQQGGFAIVTREFMRARVTQVSPASRSILIEYRFRTITA